MQSLLSMNYLQLVSENPHTKRQNDHAIEIDGYIPKLPSFFSDSRLDFILSRVCC